jgi:hypothetical protein
MAPPTTGITILIILASCILGQLLLQGREHRRHHREVMDRLERLERGRPA